MKSQKQRSGIAEICYRNISQYLMVLLLPLVVVGGYYWPKIGFTVVGLIALFMTIASRRGRFYCGWLCPMGAFHERVLSLVSRQQPIPAFFKTPWFRWGLFAVMMTFMASRLLAAWGSADAIGSVFRTMWIVSVSLAIGLGLYFKPRTWCSICPMGTLQGVSSSNTYLLSVDESCIECKKCEKVCPISTYPGAFRVAGGVGQVPSGECLRCSNCIVNCPQNSLSFRDRISLNKTL